MIRDFSVSGSARVGSVAPGHHRFQHQALDLGPPVPGGDDMRGRRGKQLNFGVHVVDGVEGFIE